MLQMKTNVYVISALVTFDLIESILNLQRSMYNGANNTPDALQYKKNINSIIVV